MPDSLRLRDQTDADADAVRALVTAAYRGLPHASGTEPAIMEALWRSGAAAVALLAEDSSGLVGQAAFSAVEIFGPGTRPNGKAPAGGWFGLGPLSVRPDRQRQGVGTALIRAGFARLEARGASGCIVVGDPAYYGRHGFRRAANLHVPGIPDRYVMAVLFGDAPPPTGTVEFHEAFSASEG
ncbi:N-acetyltransferase [Rhodoplanes sp. TEM]|uniref:N-acetyltransferase n=1 Tax=Rhodoplanes tepidamans TaxID=200616 RepID=A0ABT5JEW8_RHOTP|nr:MULTISPECIES: N-acetyltransferase [Rhodoplanes]MDC7788157.1 N-acetyltransferase [Rhodoplanes tepidamans]MDC7987251.1 N-acetyltransferase [Rhodoplanes sp. TEM]MDQ0355153.1 putative acetyltransferase [Rhodoplanes tepidamans]